MTLHIGQKVVCVDASCIDSQKYYQPEIFVGAIYTIASFGEHSDFPGEQGVHLVEIPLRIPVGDREPFGAWRFRPIVEKKTDIGFAHEILRKITRKNGERA